MFKVLTFLSIAISSFFNLNRVAPASFPSTEKTERTFLVGKDGQVINHGPRDKKEVVLTFDADMTYGMVKKLHDGRVTSYYNKAVIEVLKKENVPATLFIAGLWAKEYPDITRELAKNPLFEIGNHSYSHPKFTESCFGLPVVKNREEEFSESQRVLKDITGEEPKLFRFPGGCYSPGDLALAKKYGLTVVGWDVNSRDAFNKNTKQIVNAVEKGTQNGSIIVMHMHGADDAPATGDALPEIIKYLKEQGFTFVKAGELAGEDK